MHLRGEIHMPLKEGIDRKESCWFDRMMSYIVLHVSSNRQHRWQTCTRIKTAILPPPCDPLLNEYLSLFFVFRQHSFILQQGWAISRLKMATVWSMGPFGAAPVKHPMVCQRALEALLTQIRPILKCFDMGIAERQFLCAMTLRRDLFD